MTSSLDLWIEYILRFSHLVAGISWIGSSFYFIWLDSSFEPPEVARRNVEGEVYMVHGGFYYQVDKRKIYPGELPKNLHWFKWEATLTWVTGFLLFIYLYFLNGASLLINQQALELSQWQAIGLSLLLVAGSWLVYDLIWHPTLMKSKPLSILLSLFGFIGLTYGTTHIFSGRGAFIITGVILGSLMLANVWIRILPGQAKMLKEAMAGNVPDYSVSLKSKVRSVHNTYFTFPVLFIMISNHYPAIYNHEWNWILLILLSTAGALVRHTMVTKNKKERWLLIPAAVLLLCLIVISSLKPKELAEGIQSRPVNYSEARAIVERRCIRCHSTYNTDENWKEAPKGYIFETLAQIQKHKDKMIPQIENKVMPLGNLTQMSDGERQTLLMYLKSL